MTSPSEQPILSPFEQPRPHPEVIGRFALLGRSPASAEPRRPYGIEGSPFIANLNKLVAKPSGNKKAWRILVNPERVHVHADPDQFIGYLLGKLGVDYNDQSVSDYLHQCGEDLALLGEEVVKKAGSTLPADAPIRRAFAELDQAVSDFHGSAYDGELRFTRQLLFHAAEQAASQHRID